MIIKEFEKGFDPYAEARFLAGLPLGVRKAVLESEIKTAAYEAYLVEFRRDYQWREGRIYDAESELYISDLIRSGNRPEEEAAMAAIEVGLEKGKMVVNFSPKNEKYDYPQNCVDFWRRYGDKIIWLRFVTTDEIEDFKRVWGELGGKGEVADKFEMLARPVETDEKLVDVFERLEVAKESGEVTREKICETVARLVSEFRSEFGEERLFHSETIFRLFSAVMAEIERGNMITLADIPIDRYLYGEMMKVQVKTGGCAGFNTIGQFAQGQGYFVVSGGEGVRVMKGIVPEGYKFCSRCGVWHSGQKCPFCD
ncbi:MAG: hypothetical protein WC841_04650 [Candidatus Shapirobacteria bacterium]|jgi:hypothetical protein